MSHFLILSRVALALALGIAGLAKLGDRAGTRQMLLGFGAPSAGLTIGVIALPLVELGLAVALVAPATAWWGAIGGLVLLLLISGAVGFNLLRGRHPSCRCFGQLGAGPIGPRTLVRNGVFVALAGLLVWSGPEQVNVSLLAWSESLSASDRMVGLLGLVCAALLAGILWLQWLMLRQQGRILLRLDDLEARLSDAADERAEAASRATVQALPVGSSAPEFRLPDVAGTVWSREALQHGGAALLLLFVDPQCGPCRALLPDVPEWARALAPAVRLVAISRGSADADRSVLAEDAVVTLIQEEYEVAEAYRAWGTPSAVLVAPDGRVDSPVAGGARAIRLLVDQIRADRARASLHEVPVVPSSDRHGGRRGAPAPAYSE